jgi:hypothetical protein
MCSDGPDTRVQCTEGYVQAALSLLHKMVSPRNGLVVKYTACSAEVTSGGRARGLVCVRSPLVNFASSFLQEYFHVPPVDTSPPSPLHCNTESEEVRAMQHSRESTWAVEWTHPRYCHPQDGPFLHALDVMVLSSSALWLSWLQMQHCFVSRAGVTDPSLTLKRDPSSSVFLFRVFDRRSLCSSHLG